MRPGFFLHPFEFFAQYELFAQLLQDFRLKKEGLIIFEYVDENGRYKGYPYNPNGSVENIAGICDKTGQIFGLMPHPERYISYLQHPRWTRIGSRGRGDGFAIFKNGVEFAKKHL